jgi:hypothetical protein
MSRMAYCTVWRDKASTTSFEEEASIKSYFSGKLSMIILAP